MGWSLCSTLRLHSKGTPTRPLTLTMHCIRAGIVEEITFADGECDCWLVLTCSVTVRTQVERQKSRPCGSTAFPTLQGSKTSEPRHLAGVQLDVTMLSEHQDLADAHSGCVTGRVWASEATVAPFIGRPSAVQATGVHVATVGTEACLVHSETGQSVVPGRGKVAHQPSHRQVVGSRRCKAEQAKGRHPYLVTRALVLWRSLHAHRLRDKGVGGRITSAGTSSPGAVPKKSTPATTPVAQTVSSPPVTCGQSP